MKCPYCEFENMSGADLCESCQQDLTNVDSTAKMSDFEASIIEDSIEILNPDVPVIVEATTTVGECIRIMHERGIGSVLVGSKEDLEGIFTERDMLLRLGTDLEANSARPISGFMTLDPECLELDVPIAFAINRMALGGFRHVPVTEDGELMGIISMTDILRHFCEQSPDLMSVEASADSPTS